MEVKEIKEKLKRMATKIGKGAKKVKEKTCNWVSAHKAEVTAFFAVSAAAVMAYLKGYLCGHKDGWESGYADGDDDGYAKAVTTAEREGMFTPCDNLFYEMNPGVDKLPEPMTDAMFVKWLRSHKDEWGVPEDELTYKDHKKHTYKGIG